MESDIRNVLRGEAESNIARHEQDISNVGRRRGMLNVLSSPQILPILIDSALWGEIQVEWLNECNG